MLILSPKIAKRRQQHVATNARGVSSLDDPPCGIACVGGHAQLDFRTVGLPRLHQVLDNPGGLLMFKMPFITKSEAQNTKQIRITKMLMAETFWIFVLRACFGFRHSDFGFPN